MGVFLGRLSAEETGFPVAPGALAVCCGRPAIAVVVRIPSVFRDVLWTHVAPAGSAVVAETCTGLHPIEPDPRVRCCESIGRWIPFVELARPPGPTGSIGIRTTRGGRIVTRKIGLAPSTSCRSGVHEGTRSRAEVVQSTRMMTSIANAEREPVGRHTTENDGPRRSPEDEVFEGRFA